MGKVFVKQTTAMFALLILFLTMVCVGLLVALLKAKDNHEQAAAAKVRLASSRHRGTLGASPVRIVPPSVIPSRPQNAPSTTVVSVNLSSIPITSTKPPPTTEEPEPQFRLPSHVYPEHYSLTLQPDLKRNRFSGHVQIKVNLSLPTNEFVVHRYKHLKIRRTAVRRVSDGSDVEIDEPIYYPDREFYVVPTLDTLSHEDKYFLEFDFEGVFNGSIVGFYKSTYVDSRTNETRYLATSKFQPTYARRAFPCFDEPGFKSQFTITLVHEERYRALSNMPELEPQKRPDGLLETKFRTSVPMVTYLVCFIVSDFENTDGVTSHGIPFRVFSTPDQVNKTRYALNLGMKVLDYFTDYFNVSYPLPKQDMIAIPDFVSGAMEHWGLITFRETNLLYDQSDSSTQNKQRVAVVIAHELAHMWFGNLVTMGWWDDLWLNEGFASYVEYKGVNQVEPDWDVLGQFVIEDLQSVMELDSTTSSHPIIQEVNHPDEITEIFDSISYSKGAAVLRMLEFFLGEENFRRGVSSFLKKYAYSNANTSNLWVELQEVAPKTIQELHLANIMDTWTKQMGLPVIHIFRDASNPGHVIVKQQRFLSNPAMAKEKQEESPYGYKWIIPLSYITSDGKKGIEWVTGDQHEFTIDGLDSEAWIKYNENQTGYYIVNYETYDWISLSSVLNTDPNSLSATDRSNILYDAFQLAKAGYLGYNILLNMTLYLKQERHLIPWETAYEGLVHLSKLLEFTEVNLLMRKYIYNITLPTYEDLGWDDQNNHLNNLLRTTIIGLACHSGNHHCLKEASSRLEAWMNTNKEIPTNLRSLVYHYGMAEIGREKHWNFMWQRYLKENSAQERRKLLYGLAHVREPWLISRYLEYSMDVEKVRRQDFFTVLAYVAGNPVGRPIVWNFVRDKWPWLVATFSLNDRYLGKAIKSICEKFTTQIQLDEMETFFRKYPEAGAGSMARQQALEIVRNNINWLKKYKRVVHKWLLARERAPNHWLNSRLPRHIVPEHYDLTLQPNLTTGVIKGRVNITVNLLESTNCFLIHIHKVNVTKTVIRTSDGYLVNVLSAFHYKKNQFWVLETIKSLPANEQYNIYMEFTSSLNNGLVGFYKSSYQVNANETRYLATTQFEPTYARYAFPCFDEPYFKATFNVSIIHEEDYTALSNMDILETAPLEESSNLMETKFRKSVPMSTYIVAMVVSDFANITDESTKVVHRVSAKAEEIHKADYALETGMKILSFFEDYFNISYPLPKLDQIAIPDFKAGAMENWGLVTYREAYLLYDANETSAAQHQRICSIISHELAHMWFGNLVTMKWWDDLWLNEGFASFIQYKGVNEVEKSWDWLHQFVVNDFSRILEPDATLASHPILVPVNHPDEISEIFDYITYSKGATILRMLDFFLGEENFQRGLQSYLSKYAFNNTVTIDLWNELQEYASEGVNVSRVMDTWTRQMGYPFITVEKDVIDPTKFTAFQRRFLLSQEERNREVNDSSFGYLWEVPLSYMTAEDPEPKIVWIRGKEPVSFTVELKEPDTSWIKFNVKQTGYYLVKYPKEEWPKITSQLFVNHERLTPADRANLITDSLYLARGHSVPYETALDLTRYLQNEMHYVPWQAATESLGYISRVLEEDKEAKQLYRDYIVRITKPVLDNIGWEDEGSHLQRLLRVTLMREACSNGYQKCLEQAASKLYHWIERGVRISSNLRSLVYRFGMWANGTEEYWDIMWEKYKTSHSSQERNDLVEGLASINDVQILERFLELAKNPKNVRTQDFFTVLARIARNPVGRKLVWTFIRKQWNFLVERYTLNDASLGKMLKMIAVYFSTKERLDELEEFYAEHPDAGAGARARKEALSIIRNNMEWLRLFKDDVVEWFKAQGITERPILEFETTTTISL